MFDTLFKLFETQTAGFVGSTHASGRTAEASEAGFSRINHFVADWSAAETRRPSSLGGLIATWRQRHAERTALAALDDRTLADIGLSRADAIDEARKPFWQV